MNTTLITVAAIVAHHTPAALDALIERLEQECGEAGDTEGAAICRRALAGSQRARRWCAQVMADASRAAAEDDRCPL